MVFCRSGRGRLDTPAIAPIPVAKAIAAWKGVSGLAASGLTAAKLGALLRWAQAAQAKETKLRQRVAPALKRAADARLVADAHARNVVTRMGPLPGDG